MLETGWGRGGGVHVGRGSGVRLETGSGVHVERGGGVHEETGGGVHEGIGGGVSGGDCLEMGRGERGEGCTQTGVKGTHAAWIVTLGLTTLLLCIGNHHRYPHTSCYLFTYNMGYQVASLGRMKF